MRIASWLLGIATGPAAGRRRLALKKTDLRAGRQCRRYREGQRSAGRPRRLRGPDHPGPGHGRGHVCRTVAAGSTSPPTWRDRRCASRSRTARSSSRRRSWATWSSPKASGRPTSWTWRPPRRFCAAAAREKGEEFDPEGRHLHDPLPVQRHRRRRRQPSSAACRSFRKVCRTGCTGSSAFLAVGLTLVYAVSGIAINHAHHWDANYVRLAEPFSIEPAGAGPTAEIDTAGAGAAGS